MVRLNYEFNNCLTGGQGARACHQGRSLLAGIVPARAAGLDHISGHRTSREVDGPHSGPYGSRPYRRVRCADRSPLADIMIKARAA
jgi:hypothetical protein